MRALLLVVPLSGCSLITPTLTFCGEPDTAPCDAGADAGRAETDAGMSERDAGMTDAGCAMRCGGECTDVNTDPLHCGNCARSCSAPDNGSATCIDAVCGFTCDPGYAPALGECVERTAPRPISPLSTSTVTSRRPRLRWELSPRSDGARVEICRDRACTMVIHTIDATGTSAVPPMDLPPGVVFWRLFARMGSDVGTTASVTWQFNVGARSAPLDRSWGTTLDVNGDGYGDVAVGAPGASSGAGRVYVYLGGSSGPSMTVATTLTGSEASGEFGTSVASAGDVDGDGYCDLVVGAPGVGRAYVYRGGSSGLAMSPATSLLAPESGRFGAAVASAGDINADGYGDLVVGAPQATGGGRAYVYKGGSAGLIASASGRAGSDPVGYAMGETVGSAGDVDGDGFGDVFIGGSGSGADEFGRAYIYRGFPTGLDTAPATMLTGDMNSERFGISGCAGDVNGDGYADLIVGAKWAFSDAGGLYVFNGGPSGVPSGFASTATTTVMSVESDGYFGISVATGDVNGDGFSDVLAGANGRNSAYVYAGSSAGLATSPLSSLLGPDVTAGYATIVQLRDVNGDGHADTIVGAPDGGLVYIHFGGPSGAAMSPGATLTGPDPGRFGTSLASISITIRRLRSNTAGQESSG